MQISIYTKNDNLEIVAQKIDDYLDNIIIEEISIREAVRFYTDKYIAHHDFTTEQEDEKRQKILDVLLNDDNFHICMIAENILSYAEETEEELICATLEALTAMPDDDVVLTPPVFEENKEEKNNLK